MATARGICQGCWKQAEGAGTSLQTCCLGSPVVAGVLLRLCRRDPSKSRGGTRNARGAQVFRL